MSTLATPPPSTGPRPLPASARAGKQMPRLGWIELVMVAQTLTPALMFVSALQPYRVITRVFGYGVPLIAWTWYIVFGRRDFKRSMSPAALCLVFVMLWLLMSLAHPTCNTPTSALCEVFLTIGVFCPVFWAPMAIKDTRQLPRLMVLLFLCNAAGAVVGLGQVYRPDTFMPERMALLEAKPELTKGFTVETPDGLSFIRPPGLTDIPGGGAIAGGTTFLIGLALTVSPIAWWKRLGPLLLSMVGLAIIFYSQVRTTLITQVLGVCVWAVVLTMRGEGKKLAILSVCAVLLGFGVVAWIMRSGGGGSVIFERFFELLDDKTSTVYYNNRGRFVETAFASHLPKYPLGAGPGRIGMASVYFGDVEAPPERAPMYAETQIEVWVLDGGWPLLLLYPLAVLLAFSAAWRIAWRCKEPILAYWAGVVLIYGVSVSATCMSGPLFLTPLGVQFWCAYGALFGTYDVYRRDTAQEKLPRAR